MNIKKFLKEATRVSSEFRALRKELAEFARTPKGMRAIKKVDPQGGRKLRWYVGDISPARLVSIATKLEK